MPTKVPSQPTLAIQCKSPYTGVWIGSTYNDNDRKDKFFPKGDEWGYQSFTATMNKIISAFGSLTKAFDRKDTYYQFNESWVRGVAYIRGGIKTSVEKADWGAEVKLSLNGAPCPRDHFYIRWKDQYHKELGCTMTAYGFGSQYRWEWKRTKASIKDWMPAIQAMIEKHRKHIVPQYPNVVEFKGASEFIEWRKAEIAEKKAMKAAVEDN
jgi:hypothetical protein